MNKLKASGLSTWTLWSPLKFAITSLGIMIITTMLYTFIAGFFFNAYMIPRTPIFILLALGWLGAIILQVRTLPQINMDRKSFIAIHNAQTMILSIAFLISSYLIYTHAQQIMFNLLLLESQSSFATLFIATLAGLFYLYLFGVLFANLYAKFRRMRQINIPLWKIIFSIPFGFSALWVPGYLLNTPAPKIPSQNIKSGWYRCLTDRILSTPTNTIMTFGLITFLSGFFFGFNSILLTFALSLVFGIWVLRVGSKAFAKNIGGRYSNMAVITNIALIIIFLCFGALNPTNSQNIQMQISDTEITTQ